MIPAWSILPIRHRMNIPAPPRCTAVLLIVMSLAGTGFSFETVVIDPGHGGADEGTDWHHAREKTLTLAVAKRLENILRDNGIPTVMTRRYDHYVSLDERSELANRIPNSLLLSIHFNGSAAQSIAGFEVYHFAESPAGQLVAESIEHAFVEKIPSRDRGVHTETYAVLVRTVGLAVLVECGFVSNKVEAARYSSAEGQQELAEALALGVMRIKPLICNDPPESELAKCAIHEKKYEEAARKTDPAPSRPGKKKVSSGSAKKGKQK
jgi:N-acetylmuramoyl-L-alanine amidase